MTLLEMSAEYRSNADALDTRIKELQGVLEYVENEKQRGLLQDRIKMLSTMHHEARELACYLEHYYDRGYHLNVKYTL